MAAGFFRHEQAAFYRCGNFCFAARSPTNFTVRRQIISRQVFCQPLDPNNLPPVLNIDVLVPSGLLGHKLRSEETVLALV